MVIQVRAVVTIVGVCPDQTQVQRFVLMFLDDSITIFVVCK